MTSPYPAHWEADVVLSDGGVAHLRPIRAADAEGLRNLHARMSDRSLYLRYFAVVRQLSDAQLRVFLDADNSDVVALVAELDNQLIAAATYHRDHGHASAEVAFIVDDAHQGRGLGSILLEHLAAAAREVGIPHFTAEVLATNPQMLRVFADAGYAITREQEGGVIEVGFDIAPTDASRAVIAAREQRAEARSIARLLAAEAVLLIGSGDMADQLAANLGTFTGRVLRVAAGSPLAHAELAVIAETPTDWLALLADCHTAGVHGVVIVCPLGPQAPSQQHLVLAARSYGMRVLGPTSLGLITTDPAVQLNATIATAAITPGTLGVFCHSSALGLALIAEARRRGIGLANLVSAGHRVDISGNDLLQYWVSDRRTEAALLYLESFGNPRKFARLARNLARSKPVIVIKSGRHAGPVPGLRAGSIAVGHDVVTALLRGAGVIRARSISGALDVVSVLRRGLPGTGGVAILGNTTAGQILVHDACIEEGLSLYGQPRDLGVDVLPQDLAAQVCQASQSGAGSVVVVLVPALGTDGAIHLAAAETAAEHSRVPVIPVLLGDVTLPGVFTEAEPAVAALAAVNTYARWLDRPPGVVMGFADVDANRAAALLGQPRAERSLQSAEVRQLLECYGLPLDPGPGTPLQIALVADPSVGTFITVGAAGVATSVFTDLAWRAVPVTDRQASEALDEPRALARMELTEAQRGALVRIIGRLSLLAEDQALLGELVLEPVCLRGDQVRIGGAHGRIAHTVTDERRRMRT